MIRFGYNRKWIPRTFPASCKRHYTERTHIVTTAHNGNERCNTIALQADWTDIGVCFFSGEIYVDAFVSITGLLDQPGQIAVSIWSDDEIDELFFIEQGLF